MNKQIKRYCVTGIIVIFICYFFAQISFARIWGNWRDCVNTPGCSDESSTSILGEYIIESAGNFLKSHSHHQTFLDMFEMSGKNDTDYMALRETLNSAIEDMENSKAAYSNLIKATEKTTYNQAMIDKLLVFDYDGFRLKYGLIEPIFTKVKSLLVKGDIPGLDAAVLANLDAILSKLYAVKAVVDKNQEPELSLLWRTNQAYFEAQLFSQYMSEVFRAILF
ncbi:MAG: hypothetical protein QG657_2233 [Acidobacteriota bacterium]|nr:hypothetical protein [Acidobacteriota bacterium]